MTWLRMEAYLARSVIWAVLAAMLLLTALLGFSELLSQLGRLSEHYPLSAALGFAVLKMPAYAYEVFPMALLVGVLAGLGQLAVQGELTIVRASGWSPKRLLWGLGKGMLVLWLVMVLVGEVLAPWAEKTATQLRLDRGSASLSLSGTSGFWMKDGRRLVSVDAVLRPDRLQGVRVYELDASGRLRDWWYADEAGYTPQGWQLSGVFWQQLRDRTMDAWVGGTSLEWRQVEMASQLMTLPFDPEALQLLSQDKKNWSWPELRAQIAFFTQNGMQTQALELALWRKVAHPLMLLAMLALSIPLLLTAGRSSSMGGRVLLGVMIGLTFFLLNRVVGDLSSIQGWPAFVGALALPLLVLAGSWWWLGRLR